MDGRVLLEDSSGLPVSTVTSKLKELVDTANEAAKLTGGAEAALLVSRDDAEAAGATNGNVAGIKNWLHRFRGAMYELDEAVDGHNSCVVRQKQQQQQTGEGTSRSIRHWFRPSSTAVHKTECKRLKNTVEKLNKEMAIILQQGHQLNIQTIHSSRQRWSSGFSGEVPYHDIVGDVEHQKLELIGMLTDKKSTGALENDQSTSYIVAIVGCGGTGKTTLARKVCDDHCTRNAFSTILWVHGSKDFTDKALLSAIASAAGIKDGEAESRDKIEKRLASMLEGKRVLLILDDVWSHQINENYLETCLPVQHGSRILMTTLERSVAALESVQTYMVKEFPLPDCRSLLSRSSCLDIEQLKTGTFKDIGETLIEKCSKIQLAIKVIGGVLRTKDSRREEWHNLSECEGWSPPSDIPDGLKEIAGPIRVAYNDLPSHLKQCLLYCLHFPEGVMISKLTVMRLWISEGFIEQQENTNPEDAAEKYYKELLLRNLLQPEIGSDMACRLHDCVRYVLQRLTKDLWIGKCKSVSSNKEILPFFRTCILHKNPLGNRVLGQVPKIVKHLRVLDLTGTSIRHIPESMEPLLHLRFLNLSHTDITELPESIESLRNLQFLVLRFCCRLHSLPRGISKLQYLRTLDIEGTAPRLVLPRLDQLKQLTMLHGYIVNSEEASEEDKSGWPLEDLKSLSSLTSLQIVEIERIQQRARAKNAELSMKSQLKQLELCCSTRKANLVEEEEDRRLNDILSDLQPPKCLEYLKIVGYNGQSFPYWIMDLPKLKQLFIADCNFCECLPALGQLPELKLLRVSGCSKLRTIKTGRTGPRQVLFPKLEQLHVNDMRSMESWKGFESGDLPSLAELHLLRCPSLGSLPSCLKQCRQLTSMIVVSTDRLEAVDSLPALRELVVQDCKRLARVSNLPELKALVVVECSGLRNVNGLKLLKHLRVVDRELTSLPDWLTRHGSVLETLTIVGREVLLGSLVPGGEDWPAISGIGKVYGNLPEGMPFFAYTKSTATLEAFGARQELVNLADATDGNVASSVVENWSPASFATRIWMLSTKIRYLLFGTLPGTIYLLLLLLPNINLEPFSAGVLLVFLAYIGIMLVFFTYGMLASSQRQRKGNSRSSSSI
ncbi:hypothetical protein EJB05_55687, partial [Eragrostis curvula]